METVLFELHFRWGDLAILLVPLLVGIGFWIVSCQVGKSPGVTREGQYLVIRYIPDPDTGINHILYIAEKEAPSP